MLESKFERMCINELRKLPNSYWPDKTDALSVRGLPDRVGCVDGIYCALEFKQNAAEARRKTGRIVLQKKTLEDIERAGGFTAVVYPENWPFVLMEIESIAYRGLR